MACGELCAHRGDAACRDTESPAPLNLKAFGALGMAQVVRSSSNDAFSCKYRPGLA